MELIHTDTKGKELGVVYTTLDMEIGEDATNDFEIEYKRSEWDGTVENGCFFYVVCPAKLDHTCRCKSGHGNRQ